jgi:hypothetical protein
MAVKWLREVAENATVAEKPIYGDIPRNLA